MLYVDNRRDRSVERGLRAYQVVPDVRKRRTSPDAPAGQELKAAGGRTDQ